MTAINKKICLFLGFWLICNISAAKDVSCVPDSVVFNDILGCYLADYREYDKQLNNLYKNKIKTMTPQEQKKLKRAQNLWIKQKESTCVADEATYGRESHFEAVDCQTKMTKERIIFIKNYKP